MPDDRAGFSSINQKGNGMVYSDFITRVTNVLKKSKSGVSAKFVSKDGLFCAKCSNGTRILSNSLSDRFLVEWANGHKAIANF